MRTSTCSGCDVVKRSRRRPSTACTRSSRPAKSVAPSRYALTVWPRSITSGYPRATTDSTSATIASTGRFTSGPRVRGTTQKLQTWLHPSIAVT